MISLGPVLGFRGVAAGGWNISILLVTTQAQAPVVKSSAGTVTGPTLLKTFSGSKALRFDLGIPLTGKQQRVRYEVDGAKYDFFVPAAGQPTRLAYASCNGFSSARYAGAYTKEEEKNERWRHLLSRHRATDPLSKIAGEGGWRSEPFHLLLMGGDQVYGDAIFEIPGKINDWNTAWWKFWTKDKTSAPFTLAMEAEAMDFYFNQTYVARWSQPTVADAFASIPTLMMWDDHDIFDGWGSHPRELQECPVYAGIFKAARANFEIFQRHRKPGTSAPGDISSGGLSWGFHLGRIAVLAPDMRTERTQNQVLSSKSWAEIYAWLDGLASLPVDQRPSHLLFLSSIPVVYASLRAAETILAAIPGEQELEDDLRDHWSSRLHYGEQCRLVRRLFDFAKTASCRVTILSGDVHVAASGRVSSTLPEHTSGGYAARINQLISSAIVHTPPNMGEAFFIDHVISGDPPELESGLQAEMLKLPGTQARLRAKRNWLGLTLDEMPESRLWANWWFEGEDTEPATRVIHPAGSDDSAGA